MTKKERPDDIVNPTIREVLDLFLDEQRARLSRKTYSNYESVIHFLTVSLDNYGYISLDEADAKTFEKYRSPCEDDRRGFCEIFGPEHILPNVGEFLDYFMVRKVIAGKGLLKAAGTVTKKLAKWLGGHGYADSDDVADAVEQGASAARDLPRADDLAFQLGEFAAWVDTDGVDDRIDDRFQITRVEPGRIWLSGLLEAESVGPVTIPVDLTDQCNVGWWLSGTIGRFGHTWKLLDVWNVYPS